LSLSKKSLSKKINKLVPALYQIFEALLVSSFWYSLELFQRCSFFISSVVVNFSLFMNLFSFGNRKNSRGPSLLNTFFLLVKKLRTINVV
jgi:hypothetical protein